MFSFSQEIKGLQTQSGGDVNVEVNATPGINLMEKLNEMRSEYERLIENNRREVESWYEIKVKHRGLVTKSFTKNWTYFYPAEERQFITYYLKDINLKWLYVVYWNRPVLEYGVQHGECLCELQRES